MAKVKSFYDNSTEKPNFAGRFYRKILAHYYNLILPANASVIEVGCGDGELLAMLKPKDRVGVDISGKQVALAHQNNPDLEFVQQSGEELQMDRKFDYIILSETVNFAADVQAMFEQLHGVSHSSTKIN